MGVNMDGKRQKPRLFGAVNCGRFPAFCKRKGIDPAIEKRFPQVRMLFPDEVRFELYTGRPISREVVAFAKEASRARADVRELSAKELGEVRASSQFNQTQTWLLLLHRDIPTKAALDCTLCRTALPMLKRTAARLEAASVHVGWVNCSSEDETITQTCGEIGEATEEKTSQWGELRLVHYAGGQPTSTGLWNSDLLPPNEMTRHSLLAAHEAAAQVSELLTKSAQANTGMASLAGHPGLAKNEL